MRLSREWREEAARECLWTSSRRRPAAGDYGNVWLAFLAKARRHRSGAFMRSQVRLKSSAGPLHSKSSVEVNTGTSTRSVATVRNSYVASHAAKSDSARGRALRIIGSQ